MHIFILVLLRQVSAHACVCVCTVLGHAFLSSGLCFGLLASQKLNLDLSSLLQVDGIDLGGVKNQL